MILYHPLGKGFCKVVKQEYYDPLSSSIVLFLKCSLKRFWQGVKQDYYDPVSILLGKVVKQDLRVQWAPLIPDKTKQTRNE